MKQLLLLFTASALCGAVVAQNSKKAQVFAITGIEKGHSGWTEVRLIDVSTGEELKSIYKKNNQVEILNARTGKPVAKKDATTTQTPLVASRSIAPSQTIIESNGNVVKAYVVDGTSKTPVEIKDVKQLQELKNVQITKHGQHVTVVRAIGRRISYDHPFATNSAALAYDKKHERLYYTPMNIAQLRYIDLKTGNVYYFEDEAFGAVSGYGDVQNQITRMVINADGNGYALTNNAQHLIRFTTGKKPEITDLGAITDDPANGKYSVASSSGYGGDVIADKDNNLYLVTANRRVFKIDVETKVAVYMGTIQGLPGGFSTNAAVVEEGSKIIVASSTSTEGYFRFDLNTMQAEKASAEGSVYNASDLANGNLLFEKQKKDKKNDEPKKDEVKDEVIAEVPAQPVADREAKLSIKGSFSAYPNPVSNGVLRLSFKDLDAGTYQIQVLDMNGKIVSSNNITLSSKSQTEQLILPNAIAKGSYMIKATNRATGASMATPIVVQ